MSNSSPLIVAGLVSFSVAVNGHQLLGLDSIYRVLSIAIDKGINRIGAATLVLIDGDPATGEFPVCDAETFMAGNRIDIAVGYDNDEHLLFQGIVVGMAVASQGAQGIQVTVSCKDEAVKMTGSRVVTPFRDQTVRETLAQIIGTYPGLSASLAPTQGVQTNLVQHHRTDWDFLVTQAEANGQVVINDNGHLATVQLSTAADDALVLEYGTNIYSFSLALDPRTQFRTVTAQSWSAARQQDLTVTARQPALVTPGNVPPRQLASAVSQEGYVIRTADDLDEAALQTIADAYLAQRTLALVKGTVEIPGSHAVRPGSMVRLNRMGARFSGRAYVANVSHTIADGDWKTRLSLGTDELPFAERNPDVAPPVGIGRIAAGMQGLYTGVVKALQLDAAPGTAGASAAEAAEAGPPPTAPSSEPTATPGYFQVQVAVAALNDAVLWARLAQPLASQGTGTYFCPEVGDEVVLGFLGDDSRTPVILGALHSKSRPPAYVASGTNHIKAIVTRSKLTLEFDEDEKSITLKTPGNNRLVIADAAGGISLTDQRGNTITLSENGIELVSKSNVHIAADNNIMLEAKSGAVTISGGSAVALRGPDISASAAASLVLSSNGLTKLSAVAETEVTGTIVRIN